MVVDPHNLSGPASVKLLHLEAKVESLTDTDSSMWKRELIYWIFSREEAKNAIEFFWG